MNCVALFASGFLAAQTPTTPQKAAVKKTTTKRRTATGTTQTSTNTTHTSTSTSHKSTAAVASSNSHRAPAKKKTATVHRAVQAQPTPERYKEIQEALASRGYFNRQADGNWGPDSVDALKRFQRDQNLTDDGKIGSLSLIALGLGPKRVAPEPSSENKVQQ